MSVPLTQEQRAKLEVPTPEESWKVARRQYVEHLKSGKHRQCFRAYSKTDSDGVRRVCAVQLLRDLMATGSGIDIDKECAEKLRVSYEFMGDLMTMNDADKMSFDAIGQRLEKVWAL